VKPKKDMNESVIRELAKGIPEERFWATFVQCLFCKQVIFCETFGVNHVCGVEGRKSRRYSPYATPAKITSATRSRAVVSRLRRTYALAYIPSTPTPTVSTEYDEEQPSSRSEGGEGGGGAGNGGERHTSSDSGSAGDGVTETDSEEDPIFSSDVELPSVNEIFKQWRREKRAAQRSD
jgi:hypothetical protein